MFLCMKKLLLMLTSFVVVGWSTTFVAATQEVQTYMFVTDIEYMIPTLTMVHSLLRHSKEPKRIIFLKEFGKAPDSLIQEFFSKGPGEEEVKATAQDLVQRSVSRPDVEVIQWDVEDITKGLTELQQQAFDIFCEDVAGSRYGQNFLVNLRVMFPVCFSNENLKRAGLLPAGWDPNVMYLPHFMVFDSDMVMGPEVGIEGEYVRCVAAGLPVMGSPCPSLLFIIGGGAIFVNNKVCQSAIQNEWNITTTQANPSNVDLYAVFLSTLYTPPEQQAELQQKFGVKIDITRLANACGYRKLGKPYFPEHEEYCLTKLAIQYNFRRQRSDDFLMNSRLNFLASKWNNSTDKTKRIIHWDQLKKPWENIFDSINDRKIEEISDLTSMFPGLGQSDRDNLPYQLWLQNCLDWLDQSPSLKEDFLDWLHSSQKRESVAYKLFEEQEACGSKLCCVIEQIKSLKSIEPKEEKTEKKIKELETRTETLRQQKKEWEAKTKAIEKTPWMFFKNK